MNLNLIEINKNSDSYCSLFYSRDFTDFIYAAIDINIIESRDGDCSNECKENILKEMIKNIFIDTEEPKREEMENLFFKNNYGNLYRLVEESISNFPITHYDIDDGDIFTIRKNKKSILSSYTKEIPCDYEYDEESYENVSTRCEYKKYLISDIGIIDVLEKYYNEYDKSRIIRDKIYMLKDDEKFETIFRIVFNNIFNENRDAVYLHTLDGLITF